MATTLFEDKLGDFIGLAEKTSHGYYISNGVYHQNLEKVDIDNFAEAIITAQKMFDVAFKNQAHLMTVIDSNTSQEGFWNNLKRRQLRFDNILNNQLNLESNANNVNEIISEVKKGNEQVITQFKKATDYNLLDLPIIFLSILGVNEKATAFKKLRKKLIDIDVLNTEDIETTDFDLSRVINKIVNDKEILSWFTAKDNLVAAKNQEAKQELEHSKSQIEQDKQNAINNANKETEKAIEEAKKAQQDALKMMAEMQKKYGL